MQKAKDGSDLAWFWWIGSVGSRSNGGRRLGSAGSRRLGLVTRLQAQGSSWRLGAGSVVARGGWRRRKTPAARQGGGGLPALIANAIPTRFLLGSGLGASWGDDEPDCGVRAGHRRPQRACDGERQRTDSGEAARMRERRVGRKDGSASVPYTSRSSWASTRRG